MDRVFVDSDVILDLFIARPPFHEDALRFFSRIKRSRTAAFTSPLVIANVCYVLSRVRSPAYALSKIRAVREILSIAPITEEILDAAMATPHKDFEDGIQYQCAEPTGVTFLSLVMSSIFRPNRFPSSSPKPTCSTFDPSSAPDTAEQNPSVC